jgi:hypothetical protein
VFLHIRHYAAVGNDRFREYATLQEQDMVRMSFSQRRSYLSLLST